MSRRRPNDTETTWARKALEACMRGDIQGMSFTRGATGGWTVREFPVVTSPRKPREFTTARLAAQGDSGDLKSPRPDNDFIT